MTIGVSSQATRAVLNFCVGSNFQFAVSGQSLLYCVSSMLIFYWQQSYDQYLMPGHSLIQSLRVLIVVTGEFWEYLHEGRL